MKRLLLIAALCLFCYSAIAKEPLKSIEEYYDYFENNYSVKQWLTDVQKMALWLSENGQEGLAEFNKEKNRFWNYDTYHIWSIVVNCETGDALSHPNPANRKVVTGIKGIMKKAKDHKGNLYALEGCSKVKNQPKGVFTAIYSTWCKAKTGLGPQYANMLFVKVPNTDYELASFLPTRANSMEEANEIAEKRNKMIEKWSIIK